MLDITMTATKRPEIINTTLKTFTENLFYNSNLCIDDFRFIINIDPVGEDVSAKQIVSIVQRYFSNTVIRTPSIPSFSQAWTWCWHQAENKYVFHLEEDWKLLRPLDFNKMIQIMESNDNLAHLRLSTWRSEEQLKQWKWFLDYKGGYYKVPDDVRGTIGFCGHPSFNRLDFIQQCMANTNMDANIEKQIKWRNKPLWKAIGDYDYGVFQEPNSPAAIKDIGREWMVKHGFKKKGNREWFTEWETE